MCVLFWPIPKSTEISDFLLTLKRCNFLVTERILIIFGSLKSWDSKFSEFVEFGSGRFRESSSKSGDMWPWSVATHLEIMDISENRCSQTRFEELSRNRPAPNFTNSWNLGSQLFRERKIIKIRSVTRKLQRFKVRRKWWFRRILGLVKKIHTSVYLKKNIAKYREDSSSCFELSTGR